MVNRKVMYEDCCFWNRDGVVKHMEKTEFARLIMLP